MCNISQHFYFLQCYDCLRQRPRSPISSQRMRGICLKLQMRYGITETWGQRQSPVFLSQHAVPNLTLLIYPTHLRGHIHHIQIQYKELRGLPIPFPTCCKKKKKTSYITTFYNPTKHSLFHHFFITRSERKYNIILIKQKVSPHFPTLLREKKQSLYLCKRCPHGKTWATIRDVWMSYKSK